MKNQNELGLSFSSISSDSGNSEPLLQIIQQLPGAFYTCDAKGYITFYNDEAASLWGQKPEIGKDLWCGSWKIYWPDGTPCPLDSCPMALALREGKIVEGTEIIVERPDGQRKHILPHPRLIIDSSGKAIGAFNILVDITERKISEELVLQSQETLKQTQHRLRLALSAGAIATFIWNIPNDRMYPDENMCKIFGQVYPMEDGMPLNIFVDAIHHDDIYSTLEKVKESIERGTDYRAEYRVKGLDGLWRWVIAAGKVEYASDGSPNIFSGFLLDITDRKKTEEALAESEAKFRRVADSNMLPLAFWNVNGTIVDANKAFLWLLGYTEEDLIAGLIKWSDYVFEEDMPIHNAGIEKVTSGEVLPPYEARLKRKDGKVIYTLVSYAMLENSKENGIIFFLDITEKKQSELELKNSKHRLEQINKELKNNNEQLTKVNNDLDNFIYTASHDLKSPVSNIEGLLSTLQDTLCIESSNNEEVKTIMSLMDISIQKFRNTILELTEISKVQKLEEEDIKELNCLEVIEDVKISIQNKIKESKAEIILDLSQCISLKFSRKNFQSIIYNLLSNSLKYRSPERALKIHISTRIEGNYKVLSVKDNGMGIKEKDKIKLFTMFKRFHDHVEGTGIGLYIIKRIIDNAGGKIEVESEDGRGSEFKVFLKN